MNFNFFPSLQHMAIVKVASTLFNRRNMEFLDIHNHELKKIKTMFMKKINVMTKSEPLAEKIYNIAEELSQQCITFLEHFQSNFEKKVYPKKLYWTPEGRLDEKKVALSVIEDSSFDLPSRFKLACHYCFEEHIRKIWKIMPQSKKIPFNNKLNDEFYFPTLVFVWTCKCTGKLSLLNQWINEEVTLNQKLFQLSVYNSNKAAVEYYLSQLSDVEKEKTLPEACAILRYSTDIICFLLSKMDREQCEDVLKLYHYEWLKRLLVFPFQVFFMDIAKLIYDFLSAENFSKLIDLIMDRGKNSSKSFSYPSLLRDFWKHSPKSLKKSFISNLSRFSFLLDKLVLNHDELSIKAVLQSLSTIEKRDFILKWLFYFTDALFWVLEDGEITTEFKILKVIARECLPTSNDALSFKTELNKKIKIDFMESQWEACHKYVDQLVPNFGEISMEEDSDRSAKKFKAACL